VTTQPAAWRFTGLHWESARPLLTASPLPGKPGTPPGPETSRPAAPGERVSWLLAAPRTCTGAWTGTARRPCPAGGAIPAGTTDAQCAACARADRGRQIARDAALGDDGREYLLYLAWFGPGLLKIGLTAADRGRDRLLEQGAITFTTLAAGPYAPVRQAERLASAAGLAAERIPGRAKTAAWQHLPDAGERSRLLTAARDHVTGSVPWPARVRLLPGGVTDQAADFGLASGPPGPYQEVTGISDGAVVSGRVRLAIGRHLLLDTGAGPLLCDMRRAAGWAIRPVPGTAPAPAGLVLASAPPHGGYDDGQQTLF
jgi:hypothetical protein